MMYMKDCEEEIQLAKAEAPIEGADLLGEIFPLLEDYFVGELTLNKDAIEYRMPNGQHFRITAKQI